MLNLSIKSSKVPAHCWAQSVAAKSVLTLKVVLSISARSLLGSVSRCESVPTLKSGSINGGQEFHWGLIFSINGRSHSALALAFTGASFSALAQAPPQTPQPAGLSVSLPVQQPSQDSFAQVKYSFSLCAASVGGSVSASEASFSSLVFSVHRALVRSSFSLVCSVRSSLNFVQFL